MCKVRKKPVTFNDSKIYFIKTKHFFGFKKIRYKTFEIFVADKEKIVIDGLMSFGLPLSEIYNVIEKCKKDKLEEYALKTGNKSLIKRLGFLLEKAGYFSTELFGNLDNNYIPLNPKIKKNKKINKKWKIFVNERI